MAYTVPSAPGNADRLTQLASLKFAQTRRCVAINMNKRPVVVGFILWGNRVTAGQQRVFLSIHRGKLTNLPRARQAKILAAAQPRSPRCSSPIFLPLRARRSSRRRAILTSRTVSPSFAAISSRFTTPLHRQVQEECLSKLILFGEASLRK